MLVNMRKRSWQWNKENKLTFPFTTDIPVTTGTNEIRIYRMLIFTFFIDPKCLLKWLFVMPFCATMWWLFCWLPLELAMNEFQTTVTSYVLWNNLLFGNISTGKLYFQENNAVIIIIFITYIVPCKKCHLLPFTVQDCKIKFIHHNFHHRGPYK